MSNELKRKLRLCEQALHQNNTITKKYDQTLTLLKQKEHFTSTVIESNKNAIISTNEKQIVTIFNKSAEDMFGYSKEEMLNKDSLLNIIPEYLSAKHLKAFNHFMATRESIGIINSHVELEGKRKDGTIFPIRIGFGVAIDGDKIILVANIEDITFEKKAQNSLKELTVSLEQKVKTRTQELHQQYRYLQSVIDGIRDPVMVIDSDYTVSLMNATVKRSIDKKMIADVSKPKCYEISHHRSTPCDGDEHPCPLKQVLQTKQSTTVVHNHTAVNGKEYFAELAVSPLFDNEENCIGIIESARDITMHLQAQNKLRKQKDVLHHQAYYDGLTGLANRVLFNDALEEGVSIAKRNHTRLALFFIDLDRFKQINDSLGHDMGDIVLKEVSQRLKAKIRSTDTLARLGGDEFTILMEDFKTPHDAALLGQKIIHVLEQPIHVEGHTLYVSSSIGISLYPEDGDDASHLLKYADAAMYKAKKEGRHNYKFYSSEMTDLAFERVQMETNLYQALKNEEFLVYYQPQIDGYTDKLIGMEALVRWQHPSKGLIDPDKFLFIAEDTGLIVELDRWVMKTAMTQLVEWYKKGLNPGKLALNLARKQLQEEDFISMLYDMLIEVGMKPEWLELEITESAIMNNPQQAMAVLKSISELGVELAIDDFGTGYSSLSYLKKLPINKIKIDQSFIRELPFDEKDAGITKSIIALSKSLNLRVVAEGVETSEKRDFLVENGCIHIQGYFYSKPIPADKMEVMLQKGLNH